MDIEILDELPPDGRGRAYQSKFDPHLAAARAHPGRFIRVDGSPGDGVSTVERALNGLLYRRGLRAEFQVFRRQNVIYLTCHPKGT